MVHALVRTYSQAIVLPLVVATVCLIVAPTVAIADHTALPSSVTVAGSLQSELGCPGDWQPDCATTHLSYEVGDGVWQATFALSAGSWEYKAAVNDSWLENYGLSATQDGANILLSLAADTSVKFYYDHETHWITDNKSSVIVTAAGSYQSELGCASDWDPACLLAWLQDLDADGIYQFSTTDIPVGSYEVKATIDESFAENYGIGGTPNGANIPFSVPSPDALVTFVYNSTAHILSVQVGQVVPVPAPATLALLGIGLAGLSFSRWRRQG